MPRKRYLAPPIPKYDAVNASPDKNFTSISNSVLRDPSISFKAKGLLACLLSNKKGWVSYIEGLKKITNEGETSIASGLKELEKAGYVLKFVYRDAKTSELRGSFWAITDTRGKFDIEDHWIWASQNGMKISLHPRQTKAGSLYTENLNIANLNIGKLNIENPGLIILLDNNTNFKEYQIPPAEQDSQPIESSPVPRESSEEAKTERAAKYLPIADKLSRIVSSTKNIKHTHQQLSAWARDIRSMVEDHGISVERISSALNWYRTHVGGSYVPVIESGRSLKDKFLKLEAAVLRASAPPRNGNGTSAPINGLCCTEEEAKKYSGKVDQVLYV